jgi:3-dehydroquinate synthase
VAIGMAVDLVYSRMQGILDAETCERVLRLIERIGFATYSPHLLEQRGKAASPSFSKVWRSSASTSAVS